MSGERGANGDVGRLLVANLTDHDDVRILADNVANTGGKREPDLGVHVDLVHPEIDRYLEIPPPEVTAGKIQLSPEERERLRVLGYEE